jgi:glutathione S-transferase
MSKRIIFCADGTWNGPEQQTGVSAIDGDDQHGELSESSVTNVVKLFANLAGRVTPDTLALQNEQEKVLVNADGSTAQIAKYLHGVGNSSNLLIKLLGGTLGIGVISRIVRGYTFISRHYGPGDEIHIIGFSRGAYTARALAAMIAKVGLLNPKSYNPDNKEQAYRLGIAAWCKSKGVTLQGAGQLTDIATHFLGFVQSFFASQLRPDSLIPDIKIKSVAVWDTVGSMGIPVYAADARYDLFRFTNTALSAQVQNGFHAMSIDELRIDFPVTRWDDRQGIRQVWCAGAHSDVGGGYSQAESGLSDIGLDWMMKQLAEVGVSFATPLTYTPSAQFDQPIHEPWKKPPFDLLQTSPRQVQPADSIHDSVKERWRKFAAYRPVAMAAWAQKNVA